MARVGRQANHDQLARRGCECLASISHPALAEFRRDDGTSQIELPTIVRDVAGSGVVFQQQVAQRQVALAEIALHVLDEIACPAVFAAGQCRSRRREEFMSAWIDVLLNRPATPQCGLIELQQLFVHTAKDHGTDPAVADGQRLRPGFRGCVVMKCQRGLGKSCTGQRQQQTNPDLRLQWWGSSQVARQGTKRLGCRELRIIPGTRPFREVFSLRDSWWCRNSFVVT